MILLSRKVVESEFNFAESLELNSNAASLLFFEQSLLCPPAKVLCDGTHPIGGALNTPILLAPSRYNSCIRTKTPYKNKLVFI